MKYYISALKNIVNFKGRASRKEYWIFKAYVAAVWFAVILATYFLTKDVEVLDIALIVCRVASIIPLLSIDIRRLHDFGYPAPVWLISLIPIAGEFYFMCLMISKGDAEANKYGEPIVDNIKEITVSEKSINVMNGYFNR